MHSPNEYDHRSLPELFDESRRSWVKVDAASADEVEAAVAGCPSGALRTRRLGAPAAKRHQPPEVCASEFAAAHRRFADHRDARESDAPGQLLEYFLGTDELEPASGSLAETEVVDVPQASRHELRLGGRLIGPAAYRRRDGRIAFTHTEVDESCEGRGLGSRLAAAALDDARRQGLDVVSLCPFIAHYIERHPDYEQLVAAGYRDRLPAHGVGHADTRRDRRHTRLTEKGVGE